MMCDGLLTMAYFVLFKGLINKLKYGEVGRNNSNLASSDAMQQSNYCYFSRLEQDNGIIGLVCQPQGTSLEQQILWGVSRYGYPFINVRCYEIKCTLYRNFLNVKVV